MAVLINNGQRRRRMTFQVRSTSQDEMGAQSTTWTDAFPAWVSIEPLSGRELLAAQAVRNEVTHRIGVRYRAELASPIEAAKMRGVYRGRYFNFHSVINVEEQNVDIEIMASEGLNNG